MLRSQQWSASKGTISLETYETRQGLKVQDLGSRSQTLRVGVLIQRGHSDLPLAGENTNPLIPHALVLSEHVANLAAAHANVSGGHVSVVTDVA